MHRLEDEDAFENMLESYVANEVDGLPRGGKLFDNVPRVSDGFDGLPRGVNVFDGGISFDHDSQFITRPGRDISSLIFYPLPAPEDEEESREPNPSAPSHPNAPKIPPIPLQPGDPIPRLNVASCKPHPLEFGHHVRRRPWETGSVHPPLIVGTERPIKALWQSTSSIPSQLLHPGPFSFALSWPDSDSPVVRLDTSHDKPLFPLFYTEEGYVYLPKRVIWRDDTAALVKYAEFWGRNWEATRSPPREVAYKANLKAGMHARRYEVGRYRSRDGPPRQREELGIDWAREFREEVKILEVLGMTGSAHFSRMIGFPARSDSGFLVECDEWPGARQGRVKWLLGEEGKWSVYSVWRMFECLAKACAVMAWGSEYPDFPVEGWNQIVHLGLGQPTGECICPSGENMGLTWMVVVEISMTPDHGHTCGGDVCYKVSYRKTVVRIRILTVVDLRFQQRHPLASRRHRQ